MLPDATTTAIDIEEKSDGRHDLTYNFRGSDSERMWYWEQKKRKGRRQKGEPFPAIYLPVARRGESTRPPPQYNSLFRVVLAAHIASAESCGVALVAVEIYLITSALGEANSNFKL